MSHALIETAPLFAQHAVIVAVSRYGGKKSSCRQVFSIAVVIAAVRYLQTMFVFPCRTSRVRIPSSAPSSPSHLRELSALPGLFSRLFDRPSNREMGRKAGMSNSVGVQDTACKTDAHSDRPRSGVNSRGGGN